MCRYKSALYLANGDLIHSDATDSHEHLIAWVGLSDNTLHPNFVRLEYTSATLADIETYRLRVDQDILPDWWTNDTAADATRKLRAICERAIVTEARKILLGGAWILAGQANVEQLVNARVVEMRGTSRVGEMYGTSRVGVMGDAATAPRKPTA